MSDYVEIETQELQINRQYRTARAYRSMLNCFVAFNKGDDILLSKIDNAMVKRFEMFLKKEGKSLNTISFYIRNLRAVYNKACKELLVPRPVANPFDNTFIGIERTTKRAVQEHIIKKIANLDLKHDAGLEFAQQLFMFSFYARGMSFVDIAYLKKKNIKDGHIAYRRHKTGQLLKIRLTDKIISIIKRNESKTEGSEYLLPIILSKKIEDRLQYESALRTYNNRLAKISILLGLDNILTSYVARHSWATIAKNKNIPLPVISESLGHNSVQTTQIYLASFNSATLHKANMKVISSI